MFKGGGIKGIKGGGVVCSGENSDLPPSPRRTGRSDHCRTCLTQVAWLRHHSAHLYQDSTPAYIYTRYTYNKIYTYHHRVIRVIMTRYRDLSLSKQTPYLLVIIYIYHIGLLGLSGLSYTGAIT